ncbi:hypothetical protein LTR86_007670 [Recurvomyces mirabilis]|nr:hypothetical protein LTR86_007670 [Recurvomyces mirabilis]
MDVIDRQRKRAFPPLNPPPSRRSLRNKHYEYVSLPEYHVRVFHIDPASSLTDPLVGRFEVVALETFDIDDDGDEVAAGPRQDDGQGARVESPTTRVSNATQTSSETRHKKTRYIALSYAWCSAELTQAIFCPDRAVQVTESLYRALVRVREQLDRGSLQTSGSASRPAVWADGLCIDQANTEERNHQVQSMLRIYQSCSRLVIWLGEEAHPPKSLFDRSTESWQPDLVGAPWFGRRWVVQEYRAAQGKKRDFLYGSICRPDREVVWCLEELELLPQAGPLANEDDRSARLICELYAHQDTVCQDPRDCVYALLGISSDSVERDYDYTLYPTEDYWVDVDYTSSINRLYTAVARHYVERFGRDSMAFYFLMGCAVVRRHRRGRSSPGLPSWVPDWRHEEQISKINTYEHEGTVLAQFQDTASAYMALALEDCDEFSQYHDTLLKRQFLQTTRVSSKPEFRFGRKDHILATGSLFTPDRLSTWTIDNPESLFFLTGGTGEDPEIHDILILAERLQTTANKLFVPGDSFRSPQRGVLRSRLCYPAFILHPKTAARRKAVSSKRGIYVLEDCVVLCGAPERHGVLDILSTEPQTRIHIV